MIHSHLMHYKGLQCHKEKLKFSLFIFLSSVLPSLNDRLGDAKDQVRDQAQALLLKIMDQAATPQVYLPLLARCYRHNAFILTHKKNHNLYKRLFFSDQATY